jgi:hypothetical protein
MMPMGWLAGAVAMLMLTSVTCLGDEWFVGPSGRDDQDGRNGGSAFASLQRGLDALKAGDTLTILPGEYTGSAAKPDLGNLEVDTVIRAAVAGTVLLRGDVPVGGFTPVPGFRYVYVTDFRQPVEAVQELDTLNILQMQPTIQELEFKPGACHHDAAAGKLYVSSSDLAPPVEHHYSVAVTPGHGLLLERPRRVIVEGLAATGYNNAALVPHYPGGLTRWGVMLASARHCVVRRCTAYLNGSGIGIFSSATGVDEAGWNLIEHCTAFANENRYASEAGNIIIFNANHCEIRDCYAYLGGNCAFRFYGAGIRGPALMLRNIAWGASYSDFFLKGGQVEQFGMTRQCVALGLLHSHNIEHSIVGTKNQYNQDPPDDTIVLAREQHLVRPREFADADNLDFRLQAGSRFRDSNPSGGDRGPFSYQANIFFVRPEGNDASDGLAVSRAWKTLAHAMAKLRPGDTLYLEPGHYDAAATLTVAAQGEQRTAIRARGAGPVVVDGAIRLDNAGQLDFDRITFTDTLTLRGGRDIRLNNCRSTAGTVAIDAQAVQGLRVTQGEFTGFREAALRLKQCREVWLRGNVFDHAQGPALLIDDPAGLLYCDHNAYRQRDTAWSVAGSTPRSPVAPHDLRSITAAAEFAVDQGQPRLVNRQAFSAVRGPSGQPIGFYREIEQRDLQLQGPRLHSVTDTTANLEWWTSLPADCTVAWGTTPACENVVTLKTEPFGTFSLKGLKPATTYYFRIQSAAERSGGMPVPPRTRAIEPRDAPLAFTTESAPHQPVTWYVSPDGSDGGDGRSRATAFATVNRAADAARAGDTVLIAAGTYTETVRLRASGDEGRPITFRAIPGQRVDFDGHRRMITVAFAVNAKHHLNFDGMYFTQFGNMGWESVFNIFDSSHITITRCMMNGYGAGIAPQILRAADSSHIRMSNSVVASGFQGTYFSNTDHLTLENNVFLRNLICAILNSGGNPRGVVIRNNIFIDSIPSKVKAQLFEMGGIEQYVFDNNCFYLRVPDDQRQMFLFYGTGPGRVSLAQYEQIAGPTRSILADPQLVLSAGKKPVDKDGQPLEFLADWLVSQPGIDFPQLFTTHSELIERRIGLIPADFADFHFHRASSPDAAGKP